MKPGKGDIAIQRKISGRQLEELQRHTWMMGEAYGLDWRVENYKGKRPISFYQWDLDCLLGVILHALPDERFYPDKNDEGYVCLQALHDDLQLAYDETYPRRQPPRRRAVGL